MLRILRQIEGSRVGGCEKPTDEAKSLPPGAMWPGDIDRWATGSEFRFGQLAVELPVASPRVAIVETSATGSPFRTERLTTSASCEVR